MPYITQINRERFRALTDLMTTEEIRSPGELNYLITKLLHEYIRQHEECYQIFNDCMGALEGSKLEIYREHISRYEDIKKKENGDVV
jgi:hypothetical protein